MDVPEELEISLIHKDNGSEYTVLPVVSTYLSDSFVSRFMQIVNEADILRLLEDAGISIQGRYTQRDARNFLSQGVEDWIHNRSRTFLITRGGVPAGCFAFKSCKDDAEIGYWIGGKHRGLGTQLLGAMLKIATNLGYSQLQAITREDYTASRKILARNGFLEVDRFRKHGNRYIQHRWFATPVESRSEKSSRLEKIKKLGNLQRIR
ncbi:MAG: GNAT family N-acetyltransferase [Leptospiraceae bacterium]